MLWGPFRDKMSAVAAAPDYGRGLQPETAVFFVLSLVKSKFPSGSDSKNLPAMRETQVQSLDQEDSLEKGMTTHSSILTRRIP